MIPQRGEGHGEKCHNFVLYVHIFIGRKKLLTESQLRN